MLFSLLGAVFVLNGCKGKEQAKTEANVLRYPISANLTSIDPMFVTDVPTSRVIKHVYEGLVKFDKENNVVPALAESFDISKDGKVYTFKLRKGVKFHNGEEMTAADVKFSFERACDPKAASPSAQSFLNDIVGAEEKLSKKADKVEGVKVIDDYTVQITIKQPKLVFLSKLVYKVASVLPKSSTPPKQMNDIKQAIGTGPFKFKAFHRDQLAVLERNENYYGTQPKIEKIEIPIVKDPLTQLSQYKNGKYHYLRVPVSELEGLRKDEKLSKQLRLKQNASLFWIEFNPKLMKELQDPRVRRALAMAVDMQYIVKYIFHDSVEHAKGMVPPGIAGSRQNTARLAYNVKEANRLLDEAGFKDRSKFPKIELLAAQKSPNHVPLAESTVVQWNKNLGINAKVKQLEWVTYSKMSNDKNMPVRIAGWLADYFDASNFLSDLFARYGYNFNDYDNPKFDALCKKADTALDAKERLKLYAQAEDILLRDAIVIPGFNMNDVYLIRDDVKGLEFNLGGEMEHINVSIVTK